ncbi:phosphatidate cytidylyltransferase [Micromonospora endolithica]|uniref:Phosphatidate cytidylyltransferase n=1 Tax=Micromonospora endolithica TaxID=230091 RepID=A0A3A9ZLV6_9ACTN|nr:phosphatidate cytidylyltransferase [Micromonospora endolithica]RKN49310.1 phosphatidate cytidylyltransferase [Micromonospora endolithica]TWJ23492.1 phosphatidate cytidylyltransferase [Micromonospora endolithica]
MSHLDPYGSAEPRGRERPDRPAPGPALPWPEPQIEPAPWARRPGLAPDRHVEPRTRTRLDPEGGTPHHGNGNDPGDPGRWPDDGNPPDGGRRDDAGAPAYAGFPAGPNGRSDGPADPDQPTAQFEAVRDPGPEAAEIAPPTGRRQRGRRRAGAGRPVTGQPAPSRAGRNLPAAIGVGLLLGALIVVPLALYPPAFLLVLAAAVGVGIWEMVRAVRRADAHPPLVPLVAGGVLTVGLAGFAGLDALTLGLAVTLLGTLVWRLGDGTAGLARDLVAATVITVYVPFLAGFAALLAAAPDDGPLRVLVTVLAVVLSDTGGYAAGVRFGKRPMAPRISPKKSWEGFAGSVGAAALGSAVLLWLLFDVAPWWGALFGVAVSCAAVLGDLAESMMKRDLGIKDMSNLLPGHGGLMDRLDSILFAVPTAYLLLAVYVPVAG